jgi:hypothetical protein
VRRNGGEIAVVRELKYVLRSCHWRSHSYGGQGLSVASNNRQARSFASYHCDKKALTSNSIILKVAGPRNFSGI